MTQFESVLESWFCVPRRMVSCLHLASFQWHTFLKPATSSALPHSLHHPPVLDHCFTPSAMPTLTRSAGDKHLLHFPKDKYKVYFK